MSIVSRVLIQAVDNPVDSGNLNLYQKGDLIAVVPVDVQPGRMEVLPNYIWVNITNGNFDTHRAYWESWLSRLDFSKALLDAALDLWRVTVTMTNVPPSNRGGLTKEKVNAKLANWNISADQMAANHVEFDAKVYDVGRSSAVLGNTPQNALDQIAWSETSYNESTGVHVIRGDYSATSFTTEDVERALSGVTVITHDAQNKVFEYEIIRNKLFSEFQQYAEDLLDSRLGKNRYRISRAAVDQIVGAGGSINRTQQEFLAALIDKVETET